MIKPLLDFARRHIILFGTAKFTAGLVIGLALGVYFLPILTEEKGLDTAALAIKSEFFKGQLHRGIFNMAFAINVELRSRSPAVMAVI